MNDNLLPAVTDNKFAALLNDHKGDIVKAVGTAVGMLGGFALGALASKKLGLEPGEVIEAVAKELD